MFNIEKTKESSQIIKPGNNTHGLSVYSDFAVNRILYTIPKLLFRGLSEQNNGTIQYNLIKGISLVWEPG